LIWWLSNKSWFLAAFSVSLQLLNHVMVLSVNDSFDFFD